MHKLANMRVYESDARIVLDSLNVYCKQIKCFQWKNGIKAFMSVSFHTVSFHHIEYLDISFLRNTKPTKKKSKRKKFPTLRSKIMSY